MRPENGAESRKKTTVKWSSVDPEFNEQVIIEIVYIYCIYFPRKFVFMTNIVDLPKQSLAITVWDHNKSQQNDYIGETFDRGRGIMCLIHHHLGGLILGLNAKGERLRHWAALIKHPNKVHSRSHLLSANFLSWISRDHPASDKLLGQITNQWAEIIQIYVDKYIIR